MRFIYLPTFLFSLAITLNAESLKGTAGEGHSYPKTGVEAMVFTDCKPPLEEWMKIHDKYDSLDGACYRYNLSRSGTWPTSGVPSLTGEKWKFKTGGAVKSSPVVLKGKLYIGSEDKHFYCLDTETGELIWKVKTNAAILSSACVANGVVFFGNDKGILYAVEAVSGKVLWNVKAHKKGKISGAPAVAYGIVFIGGTKKSLPFGGVSMGASTIVGIDVKTGKQVWTGCGEGNQGFGSVIIKDELLIYGNCTSLMQVNLKTGNIVGSKPTGGLGKTWGAPSLIGDKVYITGTLVGDFQVMKKWKKGKKIKTFDFEVLAWPEQESFYVGGKSGYEVFASPTVGPDGTAYIACNDGKLYTFNTKKIIKDKDYKAKGIKENAPKRGWNFDMGVGTKSSPSLANGILYVGSDNGKLFAVDAKNGDKKWEFKTGDKISSSPWPGDGVVYVGSDDGFVYAVE